MLHEQEMQFADPDWKPSGPLTAQPAGTFPTQPAHTGAHVPLPASVTGSTTGQAYDASQAGNLSDYSQGYYGGTRSEDQYAVPPQFVNAPLGRQTPYSRSAQRARGGSRWWIWAIIVIVCISLASGLFQSTSHSSHHYGSMHPGFPGPAMQQAPGKSVFSLNGATQLQINDLSGDIIVQGLDNNDPNIIVNPSDGSQPRVNYQGQSMSLTTDGTGPVTVYVPESMALNLSAGENDIAVDGFSGQIIAQTGSGQINLGDDNLTQGSSLNTNSGNIVVNQASALSDTSVTSTSGAILFDGVNLSGKVVVSTGGNGTITYNGALDPQGTYSFTTESGNIALTLPASTAMKLKVAQKSGHYQSTFPPSSGSAPQASVGVTTNNGDITISGQ